MPTLGEILLALVTDQRLGRDEKREITLHVMRLVRSIREAQRLPDNGRRDFRDN